METENLHEEEALVIRRMILHPGEYMYWHTDACRRFTVVVRGSRLGIEYLEGEDEEFDVHAGMADWDDPESRPHRAVNRGQDIYEEVVTFYRSTADVDPQPLFDIHS